MSRHILYSMKYEDDTYEYRHVILSYTIMELLTKEKLLTANEWMKLGVQQDRDWVHYMIYDPEPHVLLFRRPLKRKVT